MIIRGVPEPFNFPWIQAIEKGLLKEFDLVWEDEPSGTGAMCKALSTGEIQMAISLTDATLKQIAMGNPSTVLDFFVLSPLIWTIHTGVQRNVANIVDFTDPSYAISCIGSGSHTMALMEASLRGDEIAKNQFHIIGTMENAVASLCDAQTDVFFWEKYMTAPFVHNGQLKRIGEIKTKWPSFVLTVQDTFYASHKEEVEKIHTIIKQECKTLSQDPQLEEKIQAYYNMDPADASQWCNEIAWNF